MLAAAVPAGLAIGGSSSLVAYTVSHGLSVAVIVVGVIATLATILGVVYGVRWRVAYEVEKAAREGEAALNESLEDRIRTLAHECDDLKASLDRATAAMIDARQTIARLEGLPNLERVLELVSGTFERIRDQLDRMHQENKQHAASQADRVIHEVKRRSAA